jgi:hypothetical protein
MVFPERLRAAALVCLCFCAVAQADEPKEPAVRMAPFVVESSFSELSLRARFRYNIPGAALKYLVITTAPKSWLKKGAHEGDQVVAIDGQAIDGKGLRDVVKLFESRVNLPMKIGLVGPKTGERRDIDVLFKKGSGNLTIHYP